MRFIGAVPRSGLLVMALCLGACAPSASSVSSAASSTGSGGSSSAPVPSTAASLPAASAGTALEDACGLLSDDEIESVTGYPVETSQPAGGFSPIGCQWDLDEGDPDLTARLLLNVLPTGGRAQFDSFRATLFEPEAVSGLGDEAVDDGGFVLAIEGEAIVGLGYPGFAFEDGMAEELVEIVLGRL